MNREELLLDRVRVLEAYVGFIANVMGSPFEPQMLVTVISITAALITNAMPNAISKAEDAVKFNEFFATAGEEAQKRIMFASQFGNIEQDRAVEIFQNVKTQFEGMLNGLETFEEFKKRFETIKDTLVPFTEVK